MQNSVTLEQDEAGGPASSGIRAYGLAAVCVGLALLLRWLLDPLWKDRLPFGSFFIAIIVVTQFTGVGPSVFAMFAGFLLADWFFVLPRHNLLIVEPVDRFNAVGYFVVSLAVLYFSQRAHRALARERTARLALKKSTATIVGDIAERELAEQERERLVGELRQEVAEREAAQRALQNSQDLTLRQERLAAVGRLAAGLAHEFNNILTVIQGHASLLLDNPNMDEDSVKSITHITEGVERTAALVKQMLAFSRKQVMQQKVMHIQETTRQIADMLGRLLGAHVVLRLDIAPELPPILADPDMLQQIIVNLAVNARDAMVEGGQLTIRAREVQLAAADLAGKPDRRAGSFVHLSVADTGSGIDPDTIGHLFEPFFTTKEVGKGTGLGLATVHGMVNQNAGWIEVDSTVGQGATFNIYFPTAENAPEERPAGRGGPRARGNGEIILVVEDEPVLRELVREILEASGYRALVAASGREALQVWANRGEDVSLLLTDMAMPDGMSGRELAAKLQAQNPRLPVIFSSGYAQETLEGRERARPDQVFLSKPYHPADLARSVRAALDHSAREEASVAAPGTSPLSA
jgi:signal transduction histidine kinase/ActR/RegA family two-component response regulator